MVHPPGGSLGAGREAGGPRPRLSQGRPRHAEAAEGGASGVGERVTMERIGIERREMMDQTTPQAERHRIDLSPYPLVALVLQGGGALGAYQAGAPGAISYYNTTALRATLEEFVDFDRIAEGQTRLSVGAVNVRTGNFAYFDSAKERIKPEHIMASGALPPGFPPVEIEGEI